MLSFEEVKSIMAGVQADPALFNAALKECEDLYSELFVGHESEFTGQDILNTLNMDDPLARYTINQYLSEIAQLEIDIDDIKHELNTADMTVIYAEIIKREAARSRAFNMHMEQCHANDYYPDEDEEEESSGGYMSIGAHLHDDEDTPYYQEDYAAEANEYALRHLVKERFDELLEQFKSTVYVELVNYKGEGESQSMLLKAMHLRVFYSKYVYGE